MSTSGAPSPSALQPPVGAEPPSVRGECHVLFAYDAGAAVDLAEAERRLGAGAASAQREVMRRLRRSPTHFQYTPAPVRVVEPMPALEVGGFRTVPEAACTVYDFGGVSVTYRVPLDGPLDMLLALADALYENAALLADSRRRVHAVMSQLGPSLRRPRLAEPVEDYAVYHLERITGAGGAVLDPMNVLGDRGPLLARILRAEPGPLSVQEIDDALSSRIGYSPSDLTVIDWNAALVAGADADDVLAVLEYANVELLQLRTLDDELDRALDRSYDEMTRRPRPSGLLRARRGSEMRRLAALQMDGALLFEGVNNALKLLGDQHLARVYRLAAQRLHLPEWDASILRKLAVLDGLYDKLADRQANLRMEILEWIIIALIAFEIGMSLWGRG